MPPLYTLWNTRFEKRWNVGSDDFVLPTILAISVRLIGFVLVVGVLVYLYAAPFVCEDQSVSTPPWLYTTLFAALLLEFAVVINDAIIMSKSCRGRIDNYEIEETRRTAAQRMLSIRSDVTENSTKLHRWPDPDSVSPRRAIKRYLCSRILLFLFEIVLSAMYGYACWSPALTDQLTKCNKFQGPIYFARAVAIAWWLVLLISCIMWIIFLDPIGLCSTGLIDQMDFLDQETEIEDPTEYDLFKFHRASVGSRKIGRRLRTLCCCCLSLTQHDERGLALEDAARVMQAIFNDVDLVGSDLVAGLILLNRDQKRKKHNNECLISEFKELTFKKMGRQFIPQGYDDWGKCLSDQHHPSFTTDIDGYILLDDLLHYCHYAVGVYGWPLYVYGHMNCHTGLCGLKACCSLAAITCCGCYCHQLADRAGNRDIIADNLCFCGFASIQLQSPNHSLKTEDIKHVTFENNYFKCPYLLCVDHAMQAVVVCVRGTLSFKDVLTDITVSMKRLRKEHIGVDIKRAYVHRGMYRTAKGIKAQLLKESKPILFTTCKNNNLYRLVITGHSLGAGVASILAVLLRKQFPDLVCYAYSPPGCVFSFPLANYSRKFITSVVIGNDMVPRLSIRALHYMKREIEVLLKKCRKPKHQVLFQPRWCDAMCHMCSNEKTYPSVSISEFQERLFEENNAIIDVCDDTFPPHALPPRPSLNRADNIVMWGCCGSKTTDSDMYQPVKKVTKREKVPSFPPGDILHLAVKYRRKPSCWGPCRAPKVESTWMKSEDLGVILADHGMIDDHMPAHVIDVLRVYHRDISFETSEIFTKEGVKARRTSLMTSTIRNKIEQRCIQLESKYILRVDSGDVESDEVDGEATEEVDGAVEVEDAKTCALRRDVTIDIEGDSVDLEETVTHEGHNATCYSDDEASMDEARLSVVMEDNISRESVVVVERYDEEYFEPKHADTTL